MGEVEYLAIHEMEADYEEEHGKEVRDARLKLRVPGASSLKQLRPQAPHAP